MTAKEARLEKRASDFRFYERELEKAQKAAMAAERRLEYLHQQIKAHKANKEDKERWPEKWGEKLVSLERQVKDATQRIQEPAEIERILARLSEEPKLPRLFEAWNKASEDERARLLSAIGIILRTPEMVGEV